PSKAGGMNPGLHSRARSGRTRNRGTMSARIATRGFACRRFEPPPPHFSDFFFSTVAPARRFSGIGTSPVSSSSHQTVRLLGPARAGDRQALSALLERHRDRLRRMVELRLDWRLQGRIDASDVLQDAFLEVATRLDEYFRGPELPLFLWLRLAVGQHLA